MAFVKMERQGKHALSDTEILESQLIALMDAMTLHKCRVYFTFVCFSHSESRPCRPASLIVSRNISSFTLESRETENSIIPRYISVIIFMLYK